MPDTSYRTIARSTAIVCLLLGIVFATFTAKAHASKGAGLMSQTMPTHDFAAKESSAEQNRPKPLALLGRKHGLDPADKDPLLRGNENAFADVLRKREQAPAAVSREQGGLLYSLGLDDEAADLKRKAFSLLVQLGFKESGKSYELRRAITNETRQVVADPAAHENKSQGGLYEELDKSAHTTAPQAAQAEKTHASEQAAQSAPAIQAAQADPAAQGTRQPAQHATQQKNDAAAAAADEEPQGTILAEGSHGLRMPVSTKLRRSLAIDLVAEKKARELLTVEAKEALLPVTGELSAVFESGKDGIAAIGYDRRGGTSYGKYQIASRVGSMKRFLNFLESEAPEFAERLRQAGPANTRSRWGGMPSEWKKIAAEDSERFELLQDKFILATNYQPAVDGIKQRANLDVAELSPAIREVLWSTAVQHGPGGASSIFAKAASVAENKSGQEFDKTFIEEVYRVRKNNFSGSTRSVRNAVRSRLNSEMNMALDLLQKPSA